MARAVLLTIALVLLASASARANGEIYTLAGSGGSGPPRDGTPAILAGLEQDAPIAALPDGGFLVAESTRVWRVDPQGLIHLVAGNGREGDDGDGGPAMKAEVLAEDVEALPGGGFLIADVTHGRVRMVDPTGTITTVAGGGELNGENVPATQAHLSSLAGLGALPGGGFLVGEGTRRVRMVGPDGRIRTFAGTNEFASRSPAPNGRPAASVPVDIESFSVAPDGSVLIADAVGGRIDRVLPDGALTVAAKVPDGESPGYVAALPDGGFAYSTVTDVLERVRVRRVLADGATTILAGAGPFIRTAPQGLQQRLSGQSAQGADLHYLSDVEATADGGLLISHSRADGFGEGGFVDYVAAAAPAVLGAAILRDRDRVFTPGALHAVTVSLTEPATVTLTVAGASLTSMLPAGVSRVVTPPLMTARPQRITLVATARDRRAFDTLRVFPPGWLPAETASLVVNTVKPGVDRCRQFGATRVDCLTNTLGESCHAMTVRLVRDRLRWARYGGCAIRSHPRRLHRAHTFSRRDWDCQSECPSRLLGRIDEAALVPAT